MTKVSLMMLALMVSCVPALSENGCDNAALAKCLSEVDDDFWSCDKQCQQDFSSEGDDYTQCRNRCRDTADSGKKSCYDNFCPTKK